MAFQFPANRINWVCNQNNNRLPDIVSSFNISLDEEGVVRLSKRPIRIYDASKDADYGSTLAIYQYGTMSFGIVTDDEMFTADLSILGTDIAQDTEANVPSPTLDSGACAFNSTYPVTEDTDIHTSANNTNTWTDQSVTLTSGKRHPCCNFKSKNWLAVADGNAVKTFDTSYSAGTTCTIPAGEEIMAIAYNAGYVGFCTLNIQGDGSFYVWDGNTTAANYSYALGTNRGYWVVPFENTFVIMSGLGQLLYWTPSGLLPLASLPVYYTKGGINDYRNVPDFCFPQSAVADGDTILFNIGSDLQDVDEFGQDYLPSMPAGVWCYDKTGGLYHKYAQAGSLFLETEFGSASVNTTNDTITVTAAPDTGTPTLYTSNGDLIGGLTPGVVYYAIKVDATTVKLATTRANALAGTAIDLTSGGAASTQQIRFFPEGDFGQLYANRGGAVFKIETIGNSDAQPFREMLFGVDCPIRTSVSDQEGLNAVTTLIPNRGSFTLSRTFATGLSDDWVKVLIRSSKLRTAEDKLVVKVKTEDFQPLQSLQREKGTVYTGTWTDSDTFTTTMDLSEAEVGDEITFIAGAGSGYTAHITSLSLDTGTYTVNIDEAINYTVATYAMYFYIDKFKKLTTITNESITNEDGYFDVPINKKARWCQVKIEMRGTNITVDDIILVNEVHKPLA